MIPIRNKKKTLSATVDEMRNFALAYTEKYAPSKQQLRTYLLKKYIKSSVPNIKKNDVVDLIDVVLSDLEKNNFINDKRYALSKIAYLASSGKSKTFVYNYLIKKGIDKSEVQDNLKSYQINDSEWEINSARLFAKKKKLLDTNTSYEKRLAKMARAGFNYEICKKVLD